MSDNKLIIIHLDYNNIEHRKAAANLHIKLLVDSYLSILGYDFLVEYYYKLLIKNKIINCLLCVSNSKYIGFAGFTKYPFSFMTIGFKKYFFQFSFFFIKRIFIKPKIIILLAKIVKEGIARKFTKKTTNSLSELLSLGVLSEHSSEKDIVTGLPASRLLFSNLIKDCKKDGFKDMRVVVKSKNVKALSFYKSVGCKIVNDKFNKDSVELILSF